MAADRKLSQLLASSEALSLASNDYAYGVVGGQSKAFRFGTLAKMVAAGGIALAAGELALSAPMVFSQTWNGAVVTFVGASNDITDTASAAASILERWRVGGLSRFEFVKSGEGNARGALGAAPGWYVSIDGDTMARMSLGINTSNVARIGFGPGNAARETFLTRGTNGGVAITNGTVIVSAPLLDLSQTWNAAGVTFVGKNNSFTDTASATGSLVEQWQVGGSNVFAIGKRGSVTVTGGTITALEPLFDLTRTWNNAGVTFTSIRLNVTDTASAAASLLMDLQVGGSSKFSVGKAGQLTSYAPTGVVFHHDPAADANDAGNKFRLAYGAQGFTNGPGGEVNYTDEVWVCGIGISTAGGAQIDPAKASIFDQWEARFYSGTTFGAERHIIHIDTTGTARRPFSIFMPNDGGAGSIAGLRSDSITLSDWAGNVDVQFILNTTPGTIDLVNSTLIRSAVNNASFLQQRDASGSFLDLLKLDAGNVAKFPTQGIYVVGARGAAGATFPTAWAAFQPTSLNSGDVMLYFPGPAVTGSLRAFELSASPTTGLSAEIFNNSATSTAYARLQLRAISGAGGDPHILFNVNGAGAWVFGLDNSDSDALVFSAGASLGSGNVLRIDASVAAFVVAPKLPSYTVGTVPSASTLGAGARIYVSNESGGAVCAFSDGASWRRDTDRAIIS